MISPKTYFLTADRTKAVEEGDKSAQFLLVRAGQEISDSLAEQYNLNVAAPSKDEAAPDKKPPKQKLK